jgi:FkbM family methyltransferase
MISYAQNFEDVILHRVFRTVGHGRYVDIGAYDPVVDSVTKHFYDRGWSGVNVEAVERFHRKFEEQRPRDWNINVVVGPREGQVEFHEWGDTGLSSYRDGLDGRVMADLGYQKTSRSLPMTTLQAIADRLPPGGVEFLKVDVEGAERDVLLGADWRSFRPRVVVVEAIRPKPSNEHDAGFEPTWFEWEGILLANGYEFALFDGLNRFYYRCEEPGLRVPLSAPANVTDGFTVAPGHFVRPVPQAA